MFKYAAIAVFALTLFTVSMVVYALLDDRPRFNVASAGQVFDVYPFWQESAVQSSEVVLDPKFSSETVTDRKAPDVVTQDALARWQDGAFETKGYQLEFGLDRVLDPTQSE